MAARPTSPYGPYGQTGPYHQKNDPWNTRRPSEWKPTYVGSSGEGIMSNPQVQKWMSGLRGPDGEPLEEPEPPASTGFGGGMRSSMSALRGRAMVDPQQQWIAQRRAADRGQGNDVNLNVALGADIAKGRALQDIENRRKDPMLGAFSSYDPQRALYETQFPWQSGPGGNKTVSYALLGKGAAMGKQIRADMPGRMKGYDPVVGRTIDLEGGEMPAAGYTPEEQDYIMSSGPALNALRRASGLGPALAR